ncbi:hypothetical protein POM88_044950 [Heracleum sosnowskyi]|uniref:DNA topoisomerase n=1 Tax=Heracleum sosnowskyi TaxID=360622 RepID=A0AAD8H658_9APIA|nr:hypothetical protein POM88_044950 [Heracleum sosnowskyi]
MESNMNLPVGFRFNPFHNELINLYLKPKVLGLKLSCDVVEERKLYGSCANPWQVFDPESHPWILSQVSCGKFEKIAYAFVNLTKKAAAKSNNKSKVGKEQYNRKAGCGTWDGKTKRTEIRDYDGNLIGERKMLVFEIDEVSHREDLSRVGHWRMYEYNLCGINTDIPNLSNTVLCKITLDHSKEPAIELHSDGTTHSIACKPKKENDTKKKNPVKVDVKMEVDVKMDAVEQCYETDWVQTCDNDDVEQIYSIYDGCTCADDELVWYNSLFVSGEDGNYETDSVQTCDKDDVEEIHSIDDGCTCADDDLDCFKLKHRMCYGPCQTPTLGFCVQRYLQINTFKPEKFWAVHPYIIHNGYELKLEWERNRLFDTYVAEMFRGLIVEDAPYPLTVNLSEVSKVELYEGNTAPPDYLSESELISLMEKNGIGTDASIPVHINNISERNYVQVQAGRRLIPTALGVSLIRVYQCIDPDLCLPDIRSFIEQQITLVSKGQANHSLVVRHVLAQFQQKFSYFVKKIENMDSLFEAQFSPLSDSGRMLSKCGKCLRYMKYISSLPSRLFCGTCEEVYYVPQKGTIKLYKEITCPLDNFELLIYSMAGPEGKSFPLCLTVITILHLKNVV